MRKNNTTDYTNDVWGFHMRAKSEKYVLCSLIRTCGLRNRRNILKRRQKGSFVSLFIPIQARTMTSENKSKLARSLLSSKSTWHRESGGNSESRIDENLQHAIFAARCSSSAGLQHKQTCMNLLVLGSS